MPDLLTDWRSWTNQQELEAATAFPGQAAYTDVEIISNNTPATLAVTGATNTGTTVTLTVASTSYSFGAATQSIQVGQTIQVAGITGFTTNNPNGTFVVTAVTPTTVSYVATAAPTGSYSSGGTVQPSEVFAAGSLGTVSIPTYANIPATVNAVDPFAGWTVQQESEVTQFAAANLSAIAYSGSSPNFVATVTTATPHNIEKAGQYVTFTGVGGATYLNGVAWQVVSVPSATTFTIGTGTNNTAYTSGGSVTQDPTARPQVTGLTSDATN